jgi:hypothetical protein
MQVDSDARDEFVRRGERLGVFAGQGSLQAQHVDVGCAIPRKADPADQMQVAQSSGGTFDVGFKLPFGFAELQPLGLTRGHNLAVKGRIATARNLSAKSGLEGIEQPLVAPDQAGLDQRRGKLRIETGRRQGIGGGSHTVSQFEARVPTVADELGNTCRVNSGAARSMEEQQVDVGKGRQLGAAGPAHCDNRRLTRDLVLRGAGKGGESIFEQLADQTVGHLADERGDLQPRRAAGIALARLIAEGLQSGLLLHQPLAQGTIRGGGRMRLTEGVNHARDPARQKSS